ncbi:hypothetical protein BV898_10606 [Hypsibius exemplaris]|uniref:Uncharacterized protein n=1 Tax=Hypsibius exemplaris TaxID=2072580 RepID=A0A1W0WJ36_HYPEX|nr:hypothetical protein BV898_10606 [Hypsibius exemplaris]
MVKNIQKSDKRKAKVEQKIEQGKALVKQTKSELTGFGLCEFVPKRTWVVGESYVHPEWYLRQEARKGTKERVRPWQTTGALQHWRAKDQNAELMKKTSSDLGFEDLNDEKLDDVKQFDFDAAERELLKSKERRKTKQSEKDPYLQFHTAFVNGPPTEDPHCYYKRPKMVNPQAKPDSDTENPDEVLGFRESVPVTLKAVMVDGKSAAFLACSFNGKADRTSSDIFAMFQVALADSKTLLPHGAFRIVPPKGVKWTVIYDKNLPRNTGTAERKRPGKTTKAKKIKTGIKKPAMADQPQSEAPEVPPKAVGRPLMAVGRPLKAVGRPLKAVGSKTKLVSPSRENTVYRNISFGDPSEPLSMSEDLLALTELPPGDRNFIVSEIQTNEATNAREAREVQHWSALSRSLWRRKRERRLDSETDGRQVSHGFLRQISSKNLARRTAAAAANSSATEKPVPSTAFQSLSRAQIAVKVTKDRDRKRVKKTHQNKEELLSDCTNDKVSLCRDYIQDFSAKVDHLGLFNVEKLRKDFADRQSVSFRGLKVQGRAKRRGSEMKTADVASHGTDTPSPTMPEGCELESLFLSSRVPNSRVP